jgi:hypothetical protein
MTTPEQVDDLEHEEHEPDHDPQPLTDEEMGR